MLLTVAYHDESVENDFLRVLAEGEVLKVWFVTLNLPVFGYRLRSLHHLLVIYFATTSLLTARTQLQYPQPL